MRNLAAAFLVLWASASAHAQILPTDPNTKWLGSFVGATDLNGTSQTGAFVVVSPFDNQGTPPLPTPYTGTTGVGPGHAIPTYPSDGSEVVIGIRSLTLALAYDASSSSWVSSNLASFIPQLGDVLLYADTAAYNAGIANQNGGSFQMFHNTSAAAFNPQNMNPSVDYSNPATLQDSGTGASTNTVLLSGVFENLVTNGVVYTTNLLLAGTDLTSGAIPTLNGVSLANYAVLAADVTSPASPGGQLALSIPDWTANIDLTGGQELGSVLQNGLQIEAFNGVDTGNTTDFRFSADLQQITAFSGIGVSSLQDLAVVQGGFTFVSVPEASSTVMCGLAGVAAVGWIRRRRQVR
jgi:hypothetical protein